MLIESRLSVRLIGALLLMTCLTGNTQEPSTSFFTIGTGGSSGVYYPMGNAICRLVNKDYSSHGIRCTIKITGGSIHNLKALYYGDLDMGITQSDWQYHAYRGNNTFKSQGPHQDLRAIFSVHSEPFTVVARTDSGIKTFDDLKGKRVNIGNPGSGQRGTMEVLMKAKGWTRRDFALTLELEPDLQNQAMCDNEVDAIVYTVGHPNRSILEATTACDATLIPVTGPEVDKLVRNNPYYAYASIPGGMYWQNPVDVPTFGVKATLVSSTKMSAEVVYLIVKSVFENFDEFRKQHLAFSHLDKTSMITDGNSAPLHPGAERYFKEVGLLD